MSTQDEKREGQYSFCTLLWIAITAALTSVCAGYHIVIFNPFTDAFARVMEWHGSNRAVRIAVATTALPLGAIVACAVVKKLFECGRKFTIQIGSLALVIGSAIISLDFFLLKARTLCFTLLLIGRLVSGFGVGIAYNTVTIFINEIAPPSVRGCFLTFHQVGNTLGILIAFLIPFSFPNHLSDSLGFPGLFVVGFTLIICIIQFVLHSFFFPFDTPKYYVSQERNDEARLALQQLYLFQSDVESELKSLKLSQISNIADSGSPIGVLWIGIALVVFQQLTGINAVLYYSNDMLLAHGVHLARVGTALVGVSQFLFGFIATFSIDKCGRKIILIIGSVLCGLMLILFGICYGKYPIAEFIFLFLYIAAFSFSHGPICWVYVGETIAPQSIGYVNIGSWVSTVVVSLCSPILLNYMRGGLYYLFAGFTFVCIPFIIFVMKETRGKTGQEIRAMFESSKLSEQS